MASEAEVKNARIESATIGICRDRGFLTVRVCFGGKGWGQCLPEYLLAWPHKPEEAGSFFAIMVCGILRVAGVNGWADLPGTVVRIRRTHDRIHAIGNAVDEVWFCPDEAFAAARESNDGE